LSNRSRAEKQERTFQPVFFGGVGGKKRPGGFVYVQEPPSAGPHRPGLAILGGEDQSYQELGGEGKKRR